MIYIISPKPCAALLRALAQDKKSPHVEIVNEFQAGRAAGEGDQVYLDMSGFTPEEFKKALARFKKARAGSFWGIVDPRGTACDPAAFFFNGASDYIGPALLKKGLDKKRFAAPLSREVPPGTLPPGIRGGGAEGAPAFGSEHAAAERKKPKKLAEGKFEGWKSVRAGTRANFFFLLVALSGNSRLHSIAGDEFFAAAKNRLRDELKRVLGEAEALLWMETEANFLFLVPPTAGNGRAAVTAALKLVLNSPLINIEKLKFALPVEFIVAMHYGETVFRAPGETGGIISESLNYIFHLGTKKAETGRLTLSAEVPEEAVPEGLLDILEPGGVFEGIPIRHSRRFIYAR